MGEPLDVVVVGGGIAGLVTAVLFARSGARLALVATDADSAAPAGDIELRNYAISPASARLLEACGAWAELAHERMGRYDRLAVWDEGSPGALEFRRERGDSGAMGWIIEHGNLRAALATCLAATGVSILRASAVGLVPGSPARMQLDDGREVAARLVVAADGPGSIVRSAAGIEFERKPYAARALVANVTTAHAHRQVAQQRFLASGPLAFLPLADPHASSIVWSCTEELAAELEVLDDAAFAARLGAAFDYRLGDISAVSTRAGFMLERAHAERWFSGNVVLVGDAAHVVHPLAGQGLNLGLMDAAALHECLGSEVTDPAWPRLTALGRYQRWRASEAQLLGTLTDALNRLFLRREAPLRWLRGAGLTLTDRLPGASTMLARLAMGEAGDVPQIVRPGAAPPAGGV